MKSSGLLVKALENEGVEYIFGIPGEEKLDFVTYAESYGAVGHRAESADDFQRILLESLNTPGVHVIDLPVDYSLNHSILNVLIKESSCIL